MKVVFTAPSYGEIDLEGRRHMRDPDGQPTDNFEAQKRRIEIQKILDVPANSALKTLYDLIIGIEKDIKTENQILSSLQRSQRVEERTGNTTAASTLKIQAKNKEEDVKKLKDDILEKLEDVAVADPALRKSWDNLDKIRK